LRAARAAVEKLDRAAITAEFFWDFRMTYYALLRGDRAGPLLAPAFFSSRKDTLEYEAT
jgi:hypothetical protein